MLYAIPSAMLSYVFRVLDSNDIIDLEGVQHLATIPRLYTPISSDTIDPPMILQPIVHRIVKS